MSMRYGFFFQRPGHEPEVIDPDTTQSESARLLADLERGLAESSFRVQTGELEVRAVNPATNVLECRYWAQPRIDLYV